MEVDNSDLRNLVREYRNESAAYLRHWILWLGLGSAGGAIAFLSLASSLPDPDHAFRVLVPSLWAFLLGVVTAAVSLLFASIRAQHAGDYFAEAHNRDSLSAAARKIPEIISAPRRIADEANVGRNTLLERAASADAVAERAWALRSRWRRLIVLCLTASALAFLFGISWPLIFISIGGQLVP